MNTASLTDLKRARRRGTIRRNLIIARTTKKARKLSLALTTEELRQRARALCYAPLYGPIGDAIADGYVYVRCLSVEACTERIAEAIEAATRQ